jgi:hypothetical protein
MKAQVGDELIIESPEPGTSGRVGTIVALQNADGSPPYVVHWLADDYDSLIYPGLTAPDRATSHFTIVVKELAAALHELCCAPDAAGRW